VLTRRTRALLLARDASAASALDVAHLIAPELGWTPGEVDRQVTTYLDTVARERASADLPQTGLTADEHPAPSAPSTAGS
jgi:hypothetical protein